MPLTMDELAAVWPDDCQLDSRDLKAIHALADAVQQLSKTLGPERAGALLLRLGQQLGVTRKAR